MWKKVTESLKMSNLMIYIVKTFYRSMITLHSVTRTLFFLVCFLHAFSMFFMIFFVLALHVSMKRVPNQVPIQKSIQKKAIQNLTKPIWRHVVVKLVSFIKKKKKREWSGMTWHIWTNTLHFQRARPFWFYNNRSVSTQYPIGFCVCSIFL